MKNNVIIFLFVNSIFLLFCPNSYLWYEGLILYAGESACFSVIARAVRSHYSAERLSVCLL